MKSINTHIAGGPCSDCDEDEQDSRLDCQGVCKDCGNGTLNNKTHEAFDYTGNGVYCLNCGSTHVDIITI
jgi:hypothetical protein